MKYLTIILAIFLVSCGALHKLKPTSDKDIACHTYGFCGPYAAVQRTGETVCYIEDYRLPKGEWKMVCR